jgi:hypothetical protein
MMQVIQIILGLCFFVLAYNRGHFISSFVDVKAKDLPLATLERQYVDIATLGYRAAWDRIIMIWTLQEGEALTGAANSDEVFRVFMNAARLKPKAHDLYLYGCASTGFKSKKFQECIDILKIGADVFPDSWSIRTFLALSYFLLKDDQSAAKAFKDASLKPNAPKYLAGIYLKFQETGVIDAKDTLDTMNQTLNDSTLTRLRERLLKENTPK